MGGGVGEGRGIMMRRRPPGDEQTLLCGLVGEEHCHGLHEVLAYDRGLNDP